MLPLFDLFQKHLNYEQEICFLSHCKTQRDIFIHHIGIESYSCSYERKYSENKTEANCIHYKSRSFFNHRIDPVFFFHQSIRETD